eukprot:711847-Amphidinium_carterae.2
MYTDFAPAEDAVNPPDLTAAQRAFERHLNTKAPPGDTDEELLESILEFDEAEIPLKHVVEVADHTPKTYDALLEPMLHYV